MKCLCSTPTHACTHMLRDTEMCNYFYTKLSSCPRTQTHSESLHFKCSFKTQTTINENKLPVVEERQGCWMPLQIFLQSSLFSSNSQLLLEWARHRQWAQVFAETSHAVKVVTIERCIISPFRLCPQKYFSTCGFVEIFSSLFWKEWVSKISIFVHPNKLCIAILSKVANSLIYLLKSY